MGTLRWQSQLDMAISRVSSTAIGKLDLEILTALRLGIYQLQFLDRIPARAAVHESVELVKRARKKSAAGFVNAVLRKIQPHPSAENPARRVTASSLQEIGELAAEYSHPVWLVQRWADAFGVQTAQRICGYDQIRPHTVIRLQDPAVERQLREEGVELAPGELLRSARRVTAGDLTRARAFRTNKFAVQDEVSQLIAHLVGRGNHILDCCAAPGGKTSIMADRNPEAYLVAVELHPHRAQLLRKLVHSPNVHVVCADARSLPLRAKFDRILVDVPCSGTGTLARNPDIKWRLQPDDLFDLQGRQVAILRAAAENLSPGGRLVYSTCSLEKEENADVVEQVLADARSFRPVDVRLELQRLQAEGDLAAGDFDHLVHGPYLRTIPGVHPCDGFFGAILEKG